MGGGGRRRGVGGCPLVQLIQCRESRGRCQRAEEGWCPVWEKWKLGKKFPESKIHKLNNLKSERLLTVSFRYKKQQLFSEEEQILDSQRDFSTMLQSPYWSRYRKTNCSLTIHITWWSTISLDYGNYDITHEPSWREQGLWLNIAFWLS